MSKKPTPKFSWNALEKQLETNAGGGKTRTDIVGGFTVEEYAAKYGVPHSTAFQRIRRMLTTGLLRKVGRYGKVTVLPDGARKVSMTWVYDIVKQGVK